MAATIAAANNVNADIDRSTLRGLVVFSKDIVCVSRFYEVVLQLDVVETHKTYHVLGADDLELVIHGIPKAVSDAVHIDSPPRERGECAMKPMFHVASLTAIRPLIDKHGGTLKSLKSAWLIRGDRVLDGTDPEGNVVQFREVAT